jgi:GNAT superfamily N-acetyltransferase
LADYVIQSSEDPSPSEVEVVFSGIKSFNEAHAGPAQFRRVHLFLRDESGAVRGGLLGKELWDWLQIEILWVDEPLRGHGFGRRLLRQAETEAAARGRKRVLLDTFEFQAPAFYLGEGYRVFGTLDDFPPGFKRHYLVKTLAEHTTEAIR